MKLEIEKMKPEIIKILKIIFSIICKLLTKMNY